MVLHSDFQRYPRKWGATEGPVSHFPGTCRNVYQMRMRLFIELALMLPVIAHGNPVSINGQSLIAFAIVAFWALVIESGVVTLVLVSCGPLIVPLFGTLVIANVLVFLFAFLPLTGRVALWLLEPGVVLADALFIKLVSSFPFVQG